MKIVSLATVAPNVLKFTTDTGHTVIVSKTEVNGSDNWSYYITRDGEPVDVAPWAERQGFAYSFDAYWTAIEALIRTLALTAPEG